MSEQQATFDIRIEPTAALLAHLAAHPPESRQPLMTITITEQEYASLPLEDGDVRRHMSREWEHHEATISRHDASDLENDLESLRKEHNEESPDRKYDGCVAPSDLSVADTWRALGVVARCTDEEGRIRPWDMSTTVTEALEDEGMTLAHIFVDEKSHEPAGRPAHGT